MSENQSFVRKVIAGRYWLLGRNDPIYQQVVKVMEFAMAHHNGKRNGGQPEFIHQIEIFHHLRSLHVYFGEHAPLIYTLAFLHDVIEDGQKQSDGTKKYVSFDDIRNLLKDVPEFAEVVCTKLRMLSKEILGQKNPEYSLETIFQDFITAIVKLADRCNNISTMMGVFKRARAIRYVTETKDQFLPNAKLARRTFPEYECVFENMKMFMNAQLQLIEMMMPNYRIEEEKPAETPVVKSVDSNEIKLRAILAYASKGAIGHKNGNLILSCPDDMEIFKSKTMGDIVVMGRKTFDSFAKLPNGEYKNNPLPGRHVIVLSSNIFHGPGYTSFHTQGVKDIKIVVNALKQAIVESKTIPDNINRDTIWFAGGASLYDDLIKANIIDEWHTTSFVDYMHGASSIRDHLNTRNDIVYIPAFAETHSLTFREVLKKSNPDQEYNSEWSTLIPTTGKFIEGDNKDKFDFCYYTSVFTKKV